MKQADEYGVPDFSAVYKAWDFYMFTLQWQARMMRHLWQEKEMTKQPLTEVFNASGMWSPPDGACCHEVLLRGGDAGTSEGPGRAGACVIVTHWKGHMEGGCKDRSPSGVCTGCGLTLKVIGGVIRQHQAVVTGSVCQGSGRPAK